jgi:hypothetical protein
MATDPEQIMRSLSLGNRVGGTGLEGDLKEPVRRFGPAVS